MTDIRKATITTLEVAEMMEVSHGDLLKKLEGRKDRKGYIQSALAKRANMAPCKLSQIVNLERRLEANEMFALCEAMGITPVELAEYEPRLPGEKGA